MCKGRICLHHLNAGRHRHHIEPCLTEIVQRFCQRLSDDSLLYFGEITRLDCILTGAAENSVNDGKSDTRIDFQNYIALQRRYCQDGDDTGVGQGLNEFLVGKLLYGDYLHIYQRAEGRRQMRIPEATEVLMNHVQGTNLILAELIRPLEVVSLDLFLLLFGLDFLRGHTAAGQGREKLVYL